MISKFVMLAHFKNLKGFDCRRGRNGRKVMNGNKEQRIGIAGAGTTARSPRAGDLPDEEEAEQRRLLSAHVRIAHGAGLPHPVHHSSLLHRRRGQAELCGVRDRSVFFRTTVTG